MAYIIQMIDTNSCPVSLTIEQREEVLETALRLVDDGNLNVKIIGDGRIYNPAEFSLTVAPREFAPQR